MDWFYIISTIILGFSAYGLIGFLVFLVFFDNDDLEKERVIAYSVLWFPYLITWIIINIVKGINLLITDIMTGYFLQQRKIIYARWD